MANAATLRDTFNALTGKTDATYLASDLLSTLSNQKHYDIRSFYNDTPTVPWTMNDMRFYNVGYFSGFTMDSFTLRRSVTGATFRRHLLSEIDAMTQTQMDALTMDKLDFAQVAAGNEEWPQTDPDVTFGKDAAYKYANTMHVNVNAGTTKDVVSKYDDDILTNFTDDTYFVEMPILGLPTQSGEQAGTALTVTGNEITDARRTEGAGTNVVAHSYDGRTSDSSFGIWESGTNLVVNGGFETNTSGWSIQTGTASLVRTTSQAKFGTSSGQITANGTGNAVGVGTSGMPITGGATYVFSAWVRREQATMPDRAQLELWWFAADGSTQIGAAVTGTPTTIPVGVWTRLTLSAPAHASASIAQGKIRFTSSDSSIIGNGVVVGQIDGVQIEQRRGASTLTTSGNEQTDVTRTQATINPTGTLTTSGNEITDTTRAQVLTTTSSGQMMDGFTSDSSYGIFRSATNLFRRGQCDATTDWNAAGAGTPSTRVTDATTPPPFSTQSIKVTTIGDAANQGVLAATNAGLGSSTGNNGVGSVYFKGVNGASYLAQMEWRNTDASVTQGTTTTFTATGNWQLLTPAPVAVAAGKTGDILEIRITVNGTRAETFWVAHAMLEQNQPYVAPYVASSGGTNGVHSASAVSASTSTLAASSGWFAARFRVGWNAADQIGFPNVFAWTNTGDNSNRLCILWDGVNKKWVMDSRINGSPSDAATALQTHSAGDFITVIGTWTPTTIGISVNGSSFNSTANTKYLIPTGSTFGIGGTVLSTSQIDSDVFWAAWGTGSPSAADVTALNALGNTDPVANTLQSSLSTRVTGVWAATNTTYTSPSFTSFTTQGDARTAPDSSFGIWEPATNLITNGGFETNTTGWSTSSGNSSGDAITRTTVDAKFGSACLQVTTSGLGGGEGCRTVGESLTPGNTYVYSAWVKGPAGVNMTFQATTPGFLGIAQTTFTGTSGWQRISLAFVPIASGNHHLHIKPTNPTASVFYIDGAQCELRRAATTATVSGGEITDATRALTTFNPTTALTVTGNEVTDTTRAQVLTTASSGQMMDGRTNDGSYGIYRTATNLFRHGQCGSLGGAGTDWNVSSAGVTLSLDATTPPPFSTQSVKAVTDGSIASQAVAPKSGSGLAAAAGVVGVSSIYFKGVAGQSYEARTRWNNTDASTTDSSALTFNATGNWQLLTPPSVAVAAGKTGDSIGIRIGINGTRAETFWVAHPMLEQGVGAVAPYVATSGGSTAQHLKSTIQGPAQGLVGVSQGWFAARVRMSFDPTTFGYATGDGPHVAFYGPTGGQEGYKVYYRAADGGWRLRALHSAGAVDTTQLQAISPGQLVTVIGYWKTTGEIGISVNGAAFTKATLSGAQMPSIATNPQLWFGNDISLGSQLNGDMFWIATGLGTLSDADAATLNALGATEPTFTTLPSTAVTTSVWAATSANTTLPSFTTATQGDALAPESSFGIWEPATNLITNGGFETNTNGAIANGVSSSIARDTTQAKFGSASLRVTSDGTSSFPGVQFRKADGSELTVTPGAVYAASAWVRLQDVLPGAGVTLRLQWQDASNNFLANTNSSTIITAITGNWVRLTVSGTAHARAASVRVVVNTSSSLVYTTFNVDGVQLELKRLATTLTTSGNEVTDATRAQTLTTASSGQMVDPNMMSSVYNAAQNSGFEVDTSGWTATAGATLTRVTTQSKFGTASAQIVTDGTGANQGFGYTTSAYVPAVTGVTWTGSVWVNAPAGATMRFFVSERDATFVGLGSTITTFTGTGTWQQVSVTRTLNQATTAFISFHVQTNLTNQAITFFVDGHQVEVGSTTSATYVDTTGAAKAQTTVSTTDSSFGIFRAATNSFGRGQCDSLGSSEWTFVGTSGGSTWAVDATTPAPFSTQSIKYITDASSVNQGVGAATATGLALATGVNVVGSIYFKGVAGQTYSARTRIKNTDATTTFGSSTVFQATGAWQLITAPLNTVAVGKTGDSLVMELFIGTGGQARAETFWAAHAMLEFGQAAVAPYVATSGGVAATHATSRVRAPATLLNSSQGWFAARVRLAWSTANEPQGGVGFPRLFHWSDDDNNELSLFYQESSNDWRLLRDFVTQGTRPAVSVTHNVGDLVTVVGAWTSTTLKVSVNGAPFVSTAQSLVPTLSASLFDIGGNASGGNGDKSNTWMLWAMSGTGTLTDTDAATLNALGNTDPNPDTTLGSTAGVTAVWTADGTSYQTPGAPKLLATPYVETSGTGASRTAPRVQLPSSLISSTQAWVATRLRMEFDSTATSTIIGGSALLRLFEWQLDVNNRIVIWLSGANQFTAVRFAGGTSGTAVSTTQTFSAGTTFTIVASWTASQVSISVNGSVFTSAAAPAPSGLPANFDIGTSAGGSGYINSEILWMAFGTGTLIDADAATLNALGNTDPAIDFLLTSTASVTAVWTADTAAYLRPGATTEIATPYVETNGGTASRAASRVQAPATLINATQGWVAFRIRPQWSSAQIAGRQISTAGANIRLMEWGTSTDRVAVVMGGGSPFIQTFRTIGGVQTGVSKTSLTWNAGDALTVVAAWDAANIYISVNGTTFSSAAVGVPTIAASLFDIGSQAGTGGFFDGEFIWGATGTGTLTNADAATLNSLGNTDPAIDSFLGAGAAVTSVWSSDSAAYLTPGVTTQIATPYIHTDGTAQTRSTPRVQIANTYTSPTQGWVAMRVRPEWASSLAASANLFALSDGTSNNRIFGRVVAGTSLQTVNSVSGTQEFATTPITLTPGSALTAVFAWTASTLKVSLNGNAFVSAARALGVPAVNTLDIGTLLGTSNFFNGEVLWFMAGTGTLVDADAASLNTLADTDPHPYSLGYTANTTVVAPMVTTATLIRSATLNLDASTIDFSSDQNFAVGQTDKVALSESTNNLSAGGNVVVRFPRSRLTTADLSNLQAIRLHLVGIGGTGASALTFMNMRLVPSTWVPQVLDTDTKKGVFTRAIPRTGQPDNTVATASPRYFNAGRPKNGQFYLRFNSGHNPVGNDNVLRFYARRETNGNHVRVELWARSTQSRLRIYENYNGVDTEIFSTPINTNLLTAETDYLMVVNLNELTINASIWNRDGVFQTTQLYTTGDQTLTHKNRGYVGYSLEPYNYDFRLDTVNTQTAEFAWYESVAFNSHAPVNGVTIEPSNSPASNLISGIALDTYGDAAATLDPSTGEYTVTRTGINYTGGLITNQTVSVGTANQLWFEGEVFLTNVRGPYRLALVDNNLSVAWIYDLTGLSANQWNSFRVPVFMQNVPPQGFYAHIQQAGFYPDTFKVRNFALNYATVDYYASVDSGTTWQPFLDAMGEDYSGLKFNPPGTALKLRAIARSDDAWIEGYVAKPHYQYPGHK